MLDLLKRFWTFIVIIIGFLFLVLKLLFPGVVEFFENINNIYPPQSKESTESGGSGKDVNPPRTSTAILTTDRTVYSEGELIRFEYSGLKSQLTNRINLVRASHPETQVVNAIDYKDVGEKGSGEFAGLKPGRYEVRAYINYRQGYYYKLAARVFIEIE